MAVIAIAALQRPLVPHLKTLLFLSQEMPQSPLRPLHLFTAAPAHEQLRLDSPHGAIVADLFVPTGSSGARPAIVLAMGVKLAEHDRPLLLRLAETMARLGFVVLFPRLEVLDQGVTLPEEPSTFVVGVRHLLDLDIVDPERVSLLGISIGASTALVAAGDPAIADNVHAVVFFGGFYDIDAYLLSLATASMVVDGHPVAWDPEPEAVGHMRQILEGKSAVGTLAMFEAASRAEAELALQTAPESELADLRRYSPANQPLNRRPGLFILHDRGDRFVPYVESVKLNNALPPGQVRAALLSSAFQHAQFKDALSLETVADVAALYGFVTQVIDHLDS